MTAARPLAPGDSAPDFELPAADADRIVALSAYRRRSPVLLLMLRGLYCPFCRRSISALRPACESLHQAGIAMLGVTIASAERARQYFRQRPPCFPIAAAPDRSLHRAYGLPEVVRTPEMRARAEGRASALLQELGIQVPPGQAGLTLSALDTAFEATDEDMAEYQRALQHQGFFLIDRDGIIRWARVETVTTPMLDVSELLALVNEPRQDVGPAGSGSRPEESSRKTTG